MKTHDDTALREVERRQRGGFRIPGIGLLQAAKVTLRAMLSKAVTVHYPEERIELPPRSRGAIALLEENCTVCMLCAKECPCWCIYINGHKEQKPGKRKAVNALDRFAIDFGLCMYCGICVEVCPFDALHWSPSFEYTSYTYEGLMHEIPVLTEWEHHVLPPPELVEDADPQAQEKHKKWHDQRAEGVWAIIREADKREAYVQRMQAQQAPLTPVAPSPPTQAPQTAPPPGEVRAGAPTSDTTPDQAPAEAATQAPAAPEPTPESAPSPQATQPAPSATAAADTGDIPRIDPMNLPDGIGPVERGRLKKLGVFQERGQAPPADLIEKLKPILDQMRGTG